MFVDRDFISKPSLWPQSEMGPYCCLKKGFGEYAFILMADNPRGLSGPINVSLGSIFDGGTGQVVEYPSLDAILEAGWIVD